MRKHMITIGTVRQAIESLEKFDPVREYLEDGDYQDHYITIFIGDENE